MMSDRIVNRSVIFVCFALIALLLATGCSRVMFGKNYAEWYCKQNIVEKIDHQELVNQQGDYCVEVKCFDGYMPDYCPENLKEFWKK